MLIAARDVLRVFTGTPLSYSHLACGAWGLWWDRYHLFDHDLGHPHLQWEVQSRRLGKTREMVNVVVKAPGWTFRGSNAKGKRAYGGRALTPVQCVKQFGMRMRMTATSMVVAAAKTSKEGILIKAAGFLWIGSLIFLPFHKKEDVFLLGL